MFVGFAATWRCRTLPRSSNVNRVRLALLSLAAGAALGLCNLAANWTIAEADPRMRAVLVERVATLGPLEALVASPIVEEDAVRAFLMGAMAWVVFRFTKRTGSLCDRAGRIRVGLRTTAPGSSVPWRYGAGELLSCSARDEYTLAGMPLGWIFWRWGLPYAIVGHAAGNAAHLALQDAVF